MNMKYFLACLTATLLCLASPSLAQGLPGRSADPYLGAIVIDAALGFPDYETLKMELCRQKCKWERGS